MRMAPPLKWTNMYVLVEQHALKERFENWFLFS